MSDREDLAKLIRETMSPGMSWRYMVHEDHEITDAILSRWRLVPVGNPPPVCPDCGNPVPDGVSFCE